MINKVILLGNVGQDPEIRFTSDNRPIANMSIATSETWKDKNSGEKQEKTEWHRVVVFGKLAEVIQKYVKKGDKLYLEGKIQTRKWTDNDGSDRYSTEIVIDLGGKMVMLSPKGSSQGQQSAPASTASQPPPPPAATPSEPAFDDDIPF